MKAQFDFPRYTYNDYKNWKEDWELVNGYPLQFLPSATAKHNKTQGSFYFQSKLSMIQNGSNCQCELFTELDWKISEETVLRPDLMIICGKPIDDYLEFPPVLIIEIISPTSIKRDRVMKFEIYREQGVKYNLMVDYTKETVEIFELIDNYYKQVQITKFQIDKNCEIEYDFDSIWN